MGGAPSPPPSELRRLAGELQLQGRWYGLQRCFVVLTADRWLYCFRREEDTDPQWSICVSSSSVRPMPGKGKLFQLEEIRRGFLGFGAGRKEIFKAETSDDARKWLGALVQAGAAVPQEANNSDVKTVSASSTPKPLQDSEVSTLPSLLSPPTSAPETSDELDGIEASTQLAIASPAEAPALSSGR